MENNQRNLSDAAAMAQFRLALIAPVIHGLYPDASRNAYYQRITADPLTLPDGSVFQYSPKTISKWVSLYQNGGIDALMPQERSDKGSTRVLTDTAIEEIYRLKEAFPRLNRVQGAGCTAKRRYADCCFGYQRRLSYAGCAGDALPPAAVWRGGTDGTALHGSTGRSYLSGWGCDWGLQLHYAAARE